MAVLPAPLSALGCSTIGRAQIFFFDSMNAAGPSMIDMELGPTLKDLEALYQHILFSAVFLREQDSVSASPSFRGRGYRRRVNSWQVPCN